MLPNLYIWKTPSDTYYFKLYKGTYKNYKINDINSYGHNLILIINLNELLTLKFPEYKFRVNYKKMVIKKIISFLQNLE